MMGANMPVPLRYGGAHTHRLSGEWGINLQNLPTVRGSKGKSKLRQGLCAPEGYSVIAADLGQIEARLVAWICGALPLLQQFRARLDPYAIMGSLIFGYPVDPKVHLLERFIGKTAILGLGYGCGATKFYNMVIMLARTLGIDLGTMWTMELAQQSVDTYRTVNAPIQYSWRKLDQAIRTAWLGKGGPVQFLPCTIEYGEVKLPSGLSLKYDRPAFDFETGEHTFYYGKFKHKIYGAKLLENIVQALARIVVMNAALRIADRGYKFALQAHDELVFVVPNSEVDIAKKIIHEEMVRPPSWAPDLPLTASIGVGVNYGEAK
jgi:DNA polymerase